MNWCVVSRMIPAAFLLVAPLDARPERPRPQLLQLDNGVMKVGIDRSMGASITWLSWQEHPENLINLHDPGRLLQQSYYAGRTLDRRREGQSKSWSPWPWNPIQGGGVHSWARVTRFEKVQDRMLVAETVPKLWDMPDEEAEARMQQSTGFEPGMPNVVRVRNRLVCTRGEEDRWGRAVPRHQELPACYFIRRFDRFECYLGDGKWRPVSQPPGPPWGRAEPPLKAMACFDAGGRGVGVFSPVAGDKWNFGPHGKADPSAKPTDPPCVHMAPIASVRLGPRTTLEYRYWLVVGDRAEIAARLDALVKKYGDEEIKLGTPVSR